MSSLSFRKIRECDLEMIMNWRLSPDITKFMNTNPQLTIDKQKKWFEKISKENDSFYRVVFSGEKPCGLVSLVGWDKNNNVIHSGVYIAEKDCRSLKNILDMNMNLFAYAIEILKVNKIAMEILQNNIGQLNWIVRFGAKKEGVLRQAIMKNGQYYDLHLFSILSSEWPEILNRIKFDRIDIEL